MAEQAQLNRIPGHCGARSWRELNSWDAVLVLAAVFLAASLAVGAAKWRCPHCGKHISDRAPLSTSHCPFCGGSLREKSE